MKKRALYILGLITLLVFPIPTFLVMWYVEEVPPLDLLQLENFTLLKFGLGVEVGILYAFIALLFMNAPVFDKLPVRVETMVRNMKLSVWDCVFLSICAGVGEELLFRSGMQFYLGPFVTSVIFVAVHGYLNPFNWRMSIYGLIVLPFILMISYGFEEFGLWFAIGAHFSYDLVLFLSMSTKFNQDD
ncbi:MAG: CPBP family intramembrane glutamic endopeptidase [Crocinitomicaceae bacterium]